jgi:hypothetical protein
VSEYLTEVDQLDLARTLFGDAKSGIEDSPDLVRLLDLATAAMEFEQLFGDDFSASSAFGAAVSVMRSQQQLEPWLYGGVAHVGWVAFHLSRTSGSSLQGVGRFDDMITEWVADFPEDRDIDLPAGLLGLGVYALVHPDPAVRERITTQILQVIRKRAEEDDGLYVRLTASPARVNLRPHMIGQRDLGVAHGAPGLISYLASASMSGLRCAGEAAQLLASALKWFLRQRSPLNGTIYPHSVESRYEPSRSAWCYGDPGISLALLVAAEATGSASVAAAAREAAAAALDRPADRARTVDACLCHGTAGLAWFGRRAAEAWKLPEARTYGARWASRIAQERRQGPLHYVGFEGTQRDNSFLEGDLGVALALAYHATGRPPLWEERLLTIRIRALGDM